MLEKKVIQLFCYYANGAITLLELHYRLALLGDEVIPLLDDTPEAYPPIKYGLKESVIKNLNVLKNKEQSHDR